MKKKKLIRKTIDEGHLWKKEFKWGGFDKELNLLGNNQWLRPVLNKRKELVQLDTSQFEASIFFKQPFSWLTILAS